MTYSQLGPDIWDKAQVDPTVLNPQYLMNQSLVRPLGEQRRHGIVQPVDDEKQRGNLRGPKVEQGFVGFDEVLMQEESEHHNTSTRDAATYLHLRPELLGHPAHSLVPNHRLLLQA